jgi:hypothetical protein
MPENALTGIVICRKASDFLKSGSMLGYACNVCEEPLQVSPFGRSAIEGGAFPLCNLCGFAMQQRIAEAKLPHDVVMSAEAARQLEEIARKVEAASKC